MKEITPNNIFTAFEILVEEIEVEIELVNKSGARAFEAGDYAPDTGSAYKSRPTHVISRQSILITEGMGHFGPDRQSRRRRFPQE
jgi:hypothetical protein